MPMTRGNWDLIRLMLEASAPQVAPSSVAFIPDFVWSIEDKNKIPKIHPATSDSSGTPFMDGLASEMGLALLGTIAKEILNELRKKAEKEGVSTLWEYFQKKIHSRKAVEDLSGDILVKIKLPRGIPQPQIQLVVNLQVQALAQAISKDLPVK